MILADTSVWVDHFRKRNAALYQQLQRNAISIHPFIVTELVLGNLPDRQKTIASLDLLPMVKVAQMSEVRRMIEAHSLFQRGIGFVDAHLIASTLITPHTVLWSRDKRLRDIAQTLGLKANIS
jgi:predicted nucleic acid-binding protein